MIKRFSLFRKGWIGSRSALFYCGLLFVGDIFFLFPLSSFAEGANFSVESHRDIHSTFDSEAEQNQGLPTNPMDLMQRLNRAESLNGATSPAEALDEALKAFNDSGGGI